MTLMEGAPVHQLIKMTGPLDIEIVRLIILQVALLIDYLHENNILYRDLKCSNIHIDINGIVKLIDLGLSKSLEKGR